MTTENVPPWKMRALAASPYGLYAVIGYSGGTVSVKPVILFGIDPAGIVRGLVDIGSVDGALVAVDRVSRGVFRGYRYLDHNEALDLQKTFAQERDGG